jgi:hypothetical protein
MVDDDSVPRIRLAADYGAFPLWPESASTRRLRLPDDLPLSAALVADLRKWGEDHDRARTARTDFEWDDNVEAESAWIKRGRSLADRLSDELGPAFEVYFPYE